MAASRPVRRLFNWLKVFQLQSCWRMAPPAANRNTLKRAILVLLVFLSLVTAFFLGNSGSKVAAAVTTVFSDDFSTNTSATFTTSGAIGASSFSVTRSGADWGARRNTAPAQLELTNDASATANANGWVFASTATSSFLAPYNTTLSSNPGLVTWNFNLRQIRTDPAGFISGSYGVAFILGGSSTTPQTTGNGYAVVLGQTGSTDPVRLVSYTGGLQGTLTNLLTSNTTGLTDFGTEHLSIRVTYLPAANTWELLLRNDGAAFADPASGTLTTQGTVVNNTHTGAALTVLGGYWQGSTAANQTAFFDNVSVTVETLATVVTITAQDAAAAETGPDAGTFRLTRTGATTSNLNVSYTISGTATNGTDYTPLLTGAATIPSGSSFVDITITPVDDPDAEGPETATLTITDTADYDLGAPGMATVTIADNDVLTLTLSCAPTTFSETAGAGAATCTVTRNGSTAAALTVNLMSNDTSEAAVPASVNIGSGSTSAMFAVDAVDDLIVDGTQTVTITASAGGFTNGTALLMVTDNDIVLTLIHDIQGNGAASPLVSQNVNVRGIVTLLKSNGFFLQEEEADYDADPNTSEGIFVFTSAAPTVLVGNQVTVTGSVVEFNNLTEISTTNANVTTNSTGVTLPTAIALTAADLPANANFAQPQLEKYEGMRVNAASLTTVAPNDDFFDVYTVVTGQPRPFREPGVPAGNTIPPDPTSGLVDPNIPVWDKNPERLKVDTNGRAGSTGETTTSNVVITNVTGPLDFAFGEYRLIPEAALTRSANMSAVPVPTPTASEYTVAGYNIENFNNAATQRQKAALTIRDVLKLPDIIGTVEIFDLADLQALAAEIQTISGVVYSAHLIEQDGVSNDNDQDVGFLVKTSRVSVTSVTQERQAETFINPNTNLPETLHDRPPLVLRGTVNPSGPSAQPVIVIVNHTRSFIDADLVTAEGVRVRAKRKTQAESLAGLLQELQTNNPTTPVIAVGDYNAFQFNNGYDDPLSVLKGAPTPDDQIVVDQSADLVNPDFYNLIEDLPADQRYSFIFEGTPQVLDHMLVNTVARAKNTRIAVARVNSDFPAVLASVFASNSARPEQNSDHDPVVGFFRLPAADLVVTKVDTPDPVTAGANLTYTITVTNNGPDPAASVTLSDTLPTGTTFVSLPSLGGWSCTTPAVGASGAISCSNPSLNVGSAIFTLTVKVGAGVASGTMLSNTAAVTSATGDANPGNESGTATTTVTASADLAVTKTNNVTTVNAGGNVTYTIVAPNAGPSNAPNATVADTFPATLSGMTWTCAGAGGAICTAAGSGNINQTVNLPAGGSVTFTATGALSGSAVGTLSNTATVTAPGGVTDPNTTNNSATDADTILNPANVSGTKTVSGAFAPGNTVTYTIVLTNSAASVQLNNPGDEFTDVLPAGLTLVSASATSGTTVATSATRTVAWNGTLAAGGSVTIIIQATINSSTAGQSLANQGTINYDADGNGTNEASRQTDDPAVAGTANATAFTVGCQPITVTPPAVSLGTAGQPFSQTFTQTGGFGAITWSFTGTLPTGITLNAATGVLSGTTTQSGHFPITVTARDANNCSGATNYTLRIAGFTGSLSDPIVCLGPGGASRGTIQISNSAPFTQAFTLNTTFTNYAGAPGSCTLTGATANSTCLIAANELSASGSLPANTTLTVTYLAQVADAPNGVEVIASNVATLGGGALAPNPLVFRATLNCPLPGPGELLPATSIVNDTKPGSVLFYNVYSSGASGANFTGSSNTQDTLLTITNTHAARPAYVHLFFVDGDSCSVADSYLCLTPNQTASFLASAFDPGVTGFLVAVAADGVTGCPINFNYLIGSEYVKFASGHAANLGAEAFAARAGGLPACRANNAAVLRFDGLSYNQAPRMLALDNVASRADGNDTLLIINRLGGDLRANTTSLPDLFGIFYDDAENALSFGFNPSSCQFRSSLSQTFPRTTPRFPQFIPAGRSGWLKISSTENAGLLGAAINFNANSGSSTTGFNQGRNLHKLLLTDAARLTIPVFPPSC